jgi:type III secretory pathway component EscT
MSPASAILVTLPLALCRSAPLLVAAPFLGWTGRLLLCALGAALFGPLFLPYVLAQAGPADVTQLAPIFLHELCIGLLLLFGAMLPWAILRAAGRILDALRATSLPEGPLSKLCGLLALCLFFGGGGAALIVAALSKSYVVAPLPSLVEPGALGLGLSPRLFLTLAGQLFVLALKLSLPLVGAWLCALLGLSLGYRFVFRAALRPIGSLMVQPGQPEAAPLQALPAIVEIGVLVAGLVALLASWQAQLGTLPYLSL